MDQCRGVVEDLARQLKYGEDALRAVTTRDKPDGTVSMFDVTGVLTHEHAGRRMGGLQQARSLAGVTGHDGREMVGAPRATWSIYMLSDLQAHHLDLGFYDTRFSSGAYLETHRCHWRDWH